MQDLHFIFFLPLIHRLHSRSDPCSHWRFLVGQCILSHDYSNVGLIWGFNSPNFLCLTILLCHSAWGGGGKSSLTSLFPSAVTESNDSEIAWCSNFSSDSSTAKQFKEFSKYVGAFAVVFPMSEQWSRIFYICCLWKFVRAIIDSMFWEYTAALRYTQSTGQEEKSCSEGISIRNLCFGE